MSNSLKGLSVRKVENHCCRWRVWGQPGLQETLFQVRREGGAGGDSLCLSKASVRVGAESHSKQEALAGRRELDPLSKGGPHVLWDWLTTLLVG